MTEPSRTEQLFQHAADLPVERRAAWLQEACGDDVTLRRRVERLLLAFDRDDGFLETPVAAAGRQPSPDRDPIRVGRYQVEGVLGTGGHGRVWAAVQDTPHRRVAIKMLHAGALSADLQVRFQREIELLGRLDHPGICQIHDAGPAEVEYADGSTAQGLFCAMERVDGVPLTQFADDRGLGLRDRIALVAAIADAVQHAHQRGVVHRDLKPQNVLVADRGSSTDATDAGALAGRPKILDFGIARLIDEAERSAAPATLPGVVLGTLGYMSPEQFDGGEIDVRCDVWALGVIAWQLVAGRLPLAVDEVPLYEVARLVREREPGPLLRRGRRVDRDLEIVLRHAMQKLPERRYGSAAEFAADLRRFLQRQPISARPPSFGYQLRLLARRHRGLFAGIGLAAAGLVASTAISIASYVAADRALDRALDSRDTALEISRFLREDLLRQADPEHTGGREVTVRELLERASTAVEGRFLGRPAVEAGVRAALARTWSGLGEGDRAVEHARRALACLESDDGQAAARLDALSALGEGLHIAGQIEESLAVRLQAHELAQRVLPDDDENRYHLAVEYGDQLGMVGRYEEAEGFLRAMVPLATARLGADNAAVLKARNNLALVLDARGRHEEAIAEYRDIIAIRRRAIGPDHPDTMTTEANLALALWHAKDLLAAGDVGRDVLERRRRVLGENHWQTLMSWNNLSLIQFDSGDREAGVASAEQALAITREVYGEDHRDTLRLEGNLASYYSMVGRLDDAQALAERALAGAVRAMPARHWTIGWHHVQVARVHSARGEHAAALDDLEQAWAIFVPALGAEHRQAVNAAIMACMIAERAGDEAGAAMWRERAGDQAPRRKD